MVAKKKTTKSVAKTQKEENTKPTKEAPKKTLKREAREYLSDKEFKLSVVGELSNLVKMKKKITNSVEFDLSKLCDENGVRYEKKPKASLKLSQVSGQLNISVKLDIKELPELSKETHGIFELKSVAELKKSETKILKKLREVITSSLRELNMKNVMDEVRDTNKTLNSEDFKSAIASKEDVSNKVYHLCDGLSSSDIKVLYSKSKKHWINYKSKKDQDSTKAKDYGGVAHCLALEPENFDKTYYVAPELDKRSHKTYFEILEMNNFAKTPIKESELEEIKRKVDLLMSNENIKKVIESSDKEVSLFIKEGKMVKKARLDMLTPISEDNIEAVQALIGHRHDVNLGQVAVFDLKFLKDIAPSEFSRDCGNYRFDISDVYYTSVLEKVLRAEDKDVLADGVVKGVTFLTIEKGDVDMVETRYIDEEDLGHSNLCVAEAIMKYEDSFDGYSQEPVKIKMPKYIKVQNHEL